MDALTCSGVDLTGDVQVLRSQKEGYPLVYHKDDYAPASHALLTSAGKDGPSSTGTSRLAWTSAIESTADHAMSAADFAS